MKYAGNFIWVESIDVLKVAGWEDASAQDLHTIQSTGTCVGSKSDAQEGGSRNGEWENVP